MLNVRRSSIQLTFVTQGVTELSQALEYNSLFLRNRGKDFEVI
jgi:hypothetical protein